MKTVQMGDGLISNSKLSRLTLVWVGSLKIYLKLIAYFKNYSIISIIYLGQLTRKKQQYNLISLILYTVVNKLSNIEK